VARASFPPSRLSLTGRDFAGEHERAYLLRIEAMARYRLLVGLVVALAIALPAVSFADSAGDNQYQDPFANTAPTNTAPAATTMPAATPAPAATAPASSSSSSPSADPAAASGQLPRTGLDLRLVGGAGVLLLGGGLLLRRRLAHD
jgi:hypothetical protein